MRVFFVALAFAGLTAQTSLALNNRSAVSVTGSDVNPCTTTSPCRSFGAAIAQTNPGGEIIALDSAGYGQFVVTGSFTISGAPGVHAAITVTSATIGIDVNAGPTDRVTLRNLVLIGSGANAGIRQALAAEVRVLNCLIRGFSGAGIEVDAGRLAVDQSTILDNINGIWENSGIDVVQATIDRSLFAGNTQGIYLFGRTSAMVTGCTISGNTTGIYVLSNQGTGSVPARVTVERSTLAYNGYGVYVSAAGGDNTARAYLSQDEISYSSVDGVVVSGQSIVYSFNNNRFTENVSATGPLTPIALK
jgi:parallel beta-helix repeat protein